MLNNYKVPYKQETNFMSFYKSFVMNRSRSLHPNTNSGLAELTIYQISWLLLQSWTSMTIRNMEMQSPFSQVPQCSWGKKMI